MGRVSPRDILFRKYSKMSWDMERLRMELDLLGVEWEDWFDDEPMPVHCTRYDSIYGECSVKWGYGTIGAKFDTLEACVIGYDDESPNGFLTWEQVIWLYPPKIGD